MTFATEILKPDSEKFILSEITARRYLPVGTSIGGSNYTWTITDNINITQVYINYGGNPFTYANGLLTINAAEDLSNAANIVMVDYKIYVTGEKTRITSGVSGLPSATWLPRIQDYPNFSQSIGDILSGIFSLSGSSINLISTDNWANSFLGSRDSLLNAPIAVWLCVNSVEYNRLVFEGTIAAVSLSNGLMSLDIIDSFNKLKLSASFGNRQQSRQYIGNTDRPSIDIRNENAAVPITIGYCSPIQIKESWRHLDAYGEPLAKCYHVYDGLVAVKINPSNPANTDTIEFSAGRIFDSAIKKTNFGTISAAYEQWLTRNIPASPDFTSSPYVSVWERIVYLQCSVVDCEIGDYIPELAGFVCAYGSIGYGSYNVAVSCPMYGSSVSQINTTLTSGSISIPTIANNTNPSMSVWVEGGDSINTNHFYDALALNPDTWWNTHGTRYVPFTTSISSYTHEGQTINHVYFSVNPSAANLIIDRDTQTNNPLASGTVKCRYRLQNPSGHGAALKFILKSAGMTTNDASFSQADTDLSALASLTLPYDGGEFGTYLDAAQLIVKSTMGVLKVNESREVVYTVLDTATPTQERDNTNIILGSFTTKLDSQDIYSAVRFKNPKVSTLSEISGVAPTAYVEDPVNGFLHRSERVKDFDHCLASIQNRKTFIANILTSPSVEYTLTTASVDLSSEIGETVGLTNPNIANTSGTVNAVITDISNAPSSSTIKLNELRGVP